MQGQLFYLKYDGALSERHELDFYDAAQALIGFQRSLALTAHLVLNGEIIVQAPSLKNAKILVKPPSPGSWEIAAVIAAGIWAAGSLGKENVFGHLIYSAYDYVVKASLGFHVDFSKSLGQQYEELKRVNQIPILTEAKLDGLVEKCDNAITVMHRPIVASKTALKAEVIKFNKSGSRRVGEVLNSNTFEFINKTERSKNIIRVIGRVSSYNINSFKGRIFVPAEGRPIPFELSDSSRSSNDVRLITNSLASNAIERIRGAGEVAVDVYENRSSSDVLKGYYIIRVSGLIIDDEL
ncbi:DUF7946 domain-containing protein [Labrys neptuniae]